MTKETGAEQEPKSVEIERKFVIDQSSLADLEKKGFDLKKFPHYQIAQGYLANSPEAAVRVRRKGDRFFLTYKGAPSTHVAQRVELETEISQAQFDAMWPGTEGRRVEKTRYEIPAVGGRTIELDVFHGQNQGHVIAEIEFPTTADADAYTPPDWFGPEVTQDRAFGNASIAEFGFPD